MITTSPSQAFQSQSVSRLSVGLGHAYATLGLRAREARIDSIRLAAQKASQSVRACADDASERQRLLTEVALCTYRLLDPRRRPRQIERIQLSILSENAMEMQARSRKQLLRSQAVPRDAVLQSA